MTLLEDARRLASTDPEVADFCFACGNDSHDHYDDCPWLCIDVLVEALEAAERLVGLEYVTMGDLASDSLLRADNINKLVAALRGEGVAAPLVHTQR